MLRPNRGRTVVVFVLRRLVEEHRNAAVVGKLRADPAAFELAGLGAEVQRVLETERGQCRRPNPRNREAV